MPLAHINKVRKLLKFKSEMNLQCFLWEAQSRERILLRYSHSVASIAPPIRNTAHSLQRIKLKSFITLLICANGM